MMGRLLVLTGAPESERLDWSSSGLLSTFQPAVARFAFLRRPHHHPELQPTPHDRQDISALDLAAWRSLALYRPQIPTGFSQRAGVFPNSADFLTTASISSSSDASRDGDTGGGDGEEEAGGSRLLVEFYEHSLAVHHNHCSSQLVPGPESQQQAAASQLSEDTTTIAEGTTVLKTPLPRRRGTDHLSDLEDIPPASYLTSIAPQTMTVTLIVGIISIAPPRTVETRYGATRALVEVLVGDDTKSGFAVTFWLSEADARAGTGGVLPRGLRAQDVVLMQNVALNVFRKKVYGGSLRRDMTSVHLLHRVRTVVDDDEDDTGGYYSKVDLAKAGRSTKKQQDPQLEKTRRVRDWVMKFVGGGDVGGEPKTTRSTTTARGKKRAATPRNWNQPPPLDSQ
ncbi:hypothetical protein M406DRAFT_266470 [Cryphonectria parasitica EP155]|uniref:Uncharacterized protein n=1 Tax=Cryphonectria parasitica (strain ATCC 38755 / EP155) TaxID=660469 RepID=A0A9P4XUU0_CRYP1|nr:uncharacterized protein M406DRAFT_266470 [Cryphonectria parasitica EP155]KAF3761326.1 hypothetical protein M406DRAFT_266470 [Cryphonectria parasitica EP155]